MKAPEPQGYLTEGAREIYWKICELLEGVDGIEEVDSYGLSMMAHWLYLNEGASEKSAKDGGVQITPNGYTQVTGHVTIMKTATVVFKELSAKFGLSPKDRELILKFKSKRKETDALDEL